MMKMISHRGNISGREKNLENNPTRIEEAIHKGFDCEIDLRVLIKKNKKPEFYLGHDKMEYLINSMWLEKHSDKLWIHCKNVEALAQLSTYSNLFNFFWHQNDDYTLTSKGYPWVYPGKMVPSNGIFVLPEECDLELSSIRDMTIFGVCSDFIGDI